MKRFSLYLLFPFYLASTFPVKGAITRVASVATAALTLYATLQTPAVVGQPVSFIKTFGDGVSTEYGNWGMDIKQTPSGGFAGTGYTHSENGDEIMLWEYDAYGNLTWVHILEGLSIDRESDHSRALGITTNGSYLLAGSSNGLLPGNDYNGFLLKINTTLHVEWIKVLGQAAQDYIVDLVVDGSGNTFTVGYTKSYEAPNSRYDLLLAKFNSSGDQEWLRILRGDEHDYGLGIALASDGGVLVVGGTRTYGGSSYSLLLAKFDTNGVEQFTVSSTSNTYEEAFSVTETTDGNIAVTGYTMDGGGRSDILVAKFNATGGLLWAVRVGDTRYDAGYKIVAIQEGGVAVTGSYYDTVAYGFCAITFALSGEGSLLWAKVIEGDGVDFGRSLVADNAYDILFIGHTTSHGSGSHDLLFVKLDGSGAPDCSQYVYPTVVTITDQLGITFENATIISLTDSVETISMNITQKVPLETTVCERSGAPTAMPTPLPSTSPTLPSASPTPFPSKRPTTAEPSALPTGAPSVSPTLPSESPTASPTKAPTFTPSHHPTALPTGFPTYLPTDMPTGKPTAEPTLLPSDHPTSGPTSAPLDPMPMPSSAPTGRPTQRPTKSPKTSSGKEPSPNPVRANAAGASQQESAMPFEKTTEGIVVYVIISIAGTALLVGILYYVIKKYGATRAGSIASGSQEEVARPNNPGYVEVMMRETMHNEKTVLCERNSGI